MGEFSAERTKNIHMNKCPPYKLLEVRRVVPPTTLQFFLEVFERQELLELTSNNSVLDLCSCECPHAEEADGPLVFVLRITITQHFSRFGQH